MRLYKRSVFVAVAFSLVAGCKLLSKGTEFDASALMPDLDAGAVMPATAVVVTGANADDVARFTDEQPISNVEATILSAQAMARTAPPAGPLVTTLKKDTKVVQIAKHDDYFLTAFDDPKNASQKLLGWVHQSNFTGTAAVVITSCSAGLTLFKSDFNFCAKECVSDAQCSPKVCKGIASHVSDGKTVNFCVAPPPVKDAGSAVLPSVPDAGSTVAKDAGSAAPTVDAGAAAKKDPEKPSMGGGCEPGYRLVETDKKCHLICSAGAAGAFAACGSTRCTKGCGEPAVCASKPNCAK